ncbi:hypothetical protein ACLX1H_004131 [Fusarium chlamydosporum]
MKVCYNGMPRDEEWQERVERGTSDLEEQMRSLDKEAQDLENQRRSAPSESPWEWDIIKPFAQILSASGGPRLRSREEIEDSMRGLREKYDNVYRNCQDGKSEFRNATESIEALHNSMHDLSTHAEDVAAAISNINFAASRLIMDNEELSRKLRYLQEDLMMEADYEGKLGKSLNSQVDEISECYAMWEEVRRVGRIFSSRLFIKRRETSSSNMISWHLFDWRVINLEDA